jgi:hypothetical protein
MAKQRLRRMLEESKDAVPCPHCGCYQADMIPLLLKDRLTGMQVLGIVGLIVGVIAAAISFLLTLAANSPRSNLEPVVLTIAWGVTTVVLAAGIALLLVRWRKNATYDPNDYDTEQERLKLARRNTISKEEAEAIWEQQSD